MVDVAQLVEPRIVIPAVAGSSPVVHPTLNRVVQSCVGTELSFGEKLHGAVSSAGRAVDS